MLPRDRPPSRDERLALRAPPRRGDPGAAPPRQSREGIAQTPDVGEDGNRARASLRHGIGEAVEHRPDRELRPLARGDRGQGVDRDAGERVQGFAPPDDRGKRRNRLAPAAARESLRRAELEHVRVGTLDAPPLDRLKKGAEGRPVGGAPAILQGIQDPGADGIRRIPQEPRQPPGHRGGVGLEERPAGAEAHHGVWIGEERRDPLPGRAQRSRVTAERLQGLGAAVGVRMREVVPRCGRGGREGIEKALAEKPDLIILDIMMPGMDGREAARELREKSEMKDVPILAATALFREADLKACTDAGCNGYIVKPFTFQELQAKVQELMPSISTTFPR